ncbi:MAG: (Fe-S)-binding protein, partial [Desulfobulbaceae bacterium]|nr:(Fe-S)-binding protein [Desulfobulbaceae bacterium]
MTSFPQCAKCGACTAVCPVYQSTGRESHTARGRLHLLETVDPNDPQLVDIFSKCLLCGACKSTCPRGIDIPALIIEARAAMPEITGFSSFKKFLARQAMAHPIALSALAKTAVPLGLIPNLPEHSGLRLTLANQPPGAVPI